MGDEFVAKRPNLIKSLVGRKFGKLTAIEIRPALGKANGTSYLCRCDCGKEVVVARGNLTTGTTKSCGCGRKDSSRIREMNKKHPTHGRVLSYYKRNAKIRNLDWKLTNDEFTVLIKGNCLYCGSSPEKRLLVGKEIWFNGIDRIDNTKGYYLDNCVSCCARCNWSKNDMSGKEFIEWIQKVAAHIEEVMPYV